MNISLSVLACTPINQNTFLLITTKPAGFSFIPGHSCLLGFPDQETTKTRAFTFISTNQDEYLAFLIKRSPSSESVTHDFIRAQPGQELCIRGLFGTHRATTPGTFVASGIGIAPFLAYARNHPELTKQSTLFWSLKKAEDIIYEQELRQAFKEVIITLTQESNQMYKHGRITKELLATLPLTNTQVCGSYEFSTAIKELLMLLTH